jgi:hypothetical protein
MSAQNQSADETGQRRGVRIVNELVDGCQDKVTEYKNRRSSHPNTLENYEGTYNHHKNLNELYELVDRTWRQLRWFVKNELEESYWDNGEIEWPQVTFVSDGSVAGMKALDWFPEKASIEVHGMAEGYHGKPTEQIIYQTQIPFRTQRKCILKFDEIRNELGFGPNARTKREKVKIDDEMVEEVLEWREKNV